MKECHYCGPTEEETRPYGPGGAIVCFPCAFSTPEREKQTEQAYLALLEAVSAVSPVIVLGGEDGPTGIGGLE